MPGVDEAVVLVRSKDGRDHEQAVLPPCYEFVADPGELRRCRGNPPIRRQMTDFDPFAAQIVGHFGDCEGQIAGSIVLVEVDEIFQQGEGLVF